MVSGSNEQRSQCHRKDDQDLRQIQEVVEGRHQTMKKSSLKREKETELGGGRQVETQPLSVDSVVQGDHVELLLAEAHGSRGLESRTIRQLSGSNHHAALDRYRRK